MEIKEMPIEERYERLLDDHISSAATGFALFKELGVDEELGLDKSVALAVKRDQKILPSYLGIAFKVLKAITPGKAFEQVLDSFLYYSQTWHPLSDCEAVIGVKNCVLLKRMRDVVKKTGLDIDPKIICERDARYFHKLLPEFGIDAKWELEENGCRCAAKLV